MSDVLLHNTLTGKKEPLKTMVAQKVGLYVCGVTPYDEPHLGHGRCYVVFDLLKRVLRKNGYEVKHIQNFTDVDDKIIDRANQLKKDPATFAETYIQSYKKWMKELNVEPADFYPRVTTHMKEIVQMIETLIRKGLAYNVEGNVFYSVRKFPDYGRLSKRKLDELAAGARVEVNEKKNDPLDFALWKKAKPGEPSWPSPWGQGRPGWHIECSAMSTKYLGDEFDIHGGGLDLIFPHHENEIAQSIGATGKPFAHTWIHNGFVTINQEKMSKSLGNFFTMKDILSQYDAMSVRYFLLAQHYRSPLNYSDGELQAARAAWTQRICEAYRLAEKWKKESGDSTTGGAAVEEAENQFEKFLVELNNDLNTSGALGHMNQLVSYIFVNDQSYGSKIGKKAWAALFDSLSSMLDLFGLVVPAAQEASAEALKLLKERDAARSKKDFAAADKLRDQLKSLGYIIEDTSQGSRLKKIQ